MAGRRRTVRKQPRRRRDERDARVEWILDAALEIVVAEGSAALTTPALAKRLGYTPAAFYRYFASKGALLAALEMRTAERLYARYFESLAAARARIEPRLVRASPRVRALAAVALLGRTYVEIARATPEQFRLVGVLLTGDRSWIHGEVATRLRESVMPQVIAIIAHFAHAAEAGALAPGPAPRRAMAMWLALHAVLAAPHLATTHPELFEVDGLRFEIVRTLLVGWGGEKRDVDAAIAAVE